MLNRVKIHESDISWSSFTTLPQEKKNKVLLEVEDLLNKMVFAKDQHEMDTIFEYIISKGHDIPQRLKNFVGFLHFNDRKGHLHFYELDLEKCKIIATIKDAKTKELIEVKEGFYGWKPHRIYNRDIVHSLYRILYHPERKISRD